MFEGIQTHPGASAVSDYFAAVYRWMTIALAISGATAWAIITQPAALEYLTLHPGLFTFAMIAQLVMVVALSGWAERMAPATAIVMFLAYSALTGATFSLIFLLYTAASVLKVFLITAGAFAGLSLYGYATSRDLSGMRGFLFMSLIGIIIASVVNIFLHSPMIDWITTYAGIVVFAGLTAYDTQKLKAYGQAGLSPVRGALVLYLDFINLFLHLLRAMGNRR